MLYRLRKHLGSLLNLSAGGVFSSFLVICTNTEVEICTRSNPPPSSFSSKRIIMAVLRLTLFCISKVCWFFFFPQRPQLRNLSRSEQTSHQERWQLRKSSRTLRFWNDLDFVPCLLDSLNLNIAHTHLYHATWSSLSPSGLGECFVVVWNWHPLKNKRWLT